MQICKKNACTGCMACTNICPRGAVTVRRGINGFDYPHVNSKDCIKCGLCTKVCQETSGRISQVSGNALGFYGVKASDSIRFDSSSGGVFSILAQQIISEGGAVCAAALDDDLEVKHRIITDINDLPGLRKTKYVQSAPGNVYREILSLLLLKKKVLFVGTPCQCEGLLRYVENVPGSASAKDSLNLLYTVSLICYGAPSPGVWKYYVRLLEKKRRGRLISFEFRDKRMHDSGHTVSYKMIGRDGGTVEFTESLYTNLYCRLYFHNRIIRQSCYSCSFCTPDRHFDITIGDFWGIEKIASDLDDKMGVSLVITHSAKGQALFDSTKPLLSEIITVEREQCLQPRLIEPTKRK